MSPIAYPIINIALGRGRALVGIIFAPVIWLSLFVQFAIYTIARKLLNKSLSLDKHTPSSNIS